MRFALGTIAAIAVGVAATSSAQFTYDFQIVVTANELPAAGVGGQLATLTPGTIGLLTIEVEATPAGYPGWDTDSVKAHDILAIDVNVGAFSAQGLGALYPSTSPIVAFQLANDDLTDITNQIFTDAAACFLAWNSAEVAFSSLAVRQDSQPGQVPQLFQGISLPTAPNLLLATTKLFILESPAPGNPRVTFLVFGMQGTLSDECRGDANGDGLVTPADFGAWIGAFNTMSPACDQNNDGACTPADFGAWIANFNAGC